MHHSIICAKKNEHFIQLYKDILNVVEFKFICRLMMGININAWQGVKEKSWVTNVCNCEKKSYC